MKNKAKKQVIVWRGVKTSIELADALNIATYELGEACKCYVRSKRYPEDADAYSAEMKIALADLLTITRLIIRLKGYREKNLLLLGIERMKERVEDVKTSGNPKEA